LIALLALVVLLAVAVVVGVAARGRNGGPRRAEPAAYFLFGLSLLCLGVTVISAGIAVHAVSELVGPAPGSAILGAFPASGDLGLPPCSAASSPSPASPPSTATSSSATTLPTTATTIPADIPCINYGDSPSSSSSLLYSPLPGTSFGSSLGVASELNLFSGHSTDYYISVAVAAGLFGIAGFVGYALVWPRARWLAATSDLEDRRAGSVPVGYAYLMAGLAALALLVFVPLALDSIFRSIAPGVNETSGHAAGARDLVTFLVVAASAGAVLVYHLRFAQGLRDLELLEAEWNEVPDETDPTGSNSEGDPHRGIEGRAWRADGDLTASVLRQSPLRIWADGVGSYHYHLVFICGDDIPVCCRV